MNDLENVKKALVIGTGVSGINAAALLVHKGVEVILYDQKKDDSKLRSWNSSRTRSEAI